MERFMLVVFSVIAIVLPSLMLQSCAQPATRLETVTRDVPIPVLCKADVKRPGIPVDKATPGLPLEEQNVILRSSVAGQRQYTKRLEAAVIGCGGEIKDEQ